MRIVKTLTDLSGKRFSKLEVIKFDSIRKGHYYWWCRCDCGEEVSVDAGHLRAGKIVSCFQCNSRYIRSQENQKEDLTGLRFGRLLVTSFLENTSRGGIWNCICDCGEVRAVNYYHLKSGHTSSCGCYGKEVLLKSNITHGLRHTAGYNVWISMKDRCENENNISYHNYGGRGIKVCDRWKNSVENFFRDMGDPPSAEHQIDRIDNDGNYCPENCRWVTRKENCRNTRSNKFIFFNGENLCLAEWQERYGLPKGCIAKRLKRNWTIEEALTTPKGQKRN